MQKLIRWVCRLWAVMNILTVLALALVADGKGGSIVKVAATLGGIFLCACACGVFVLTFVPAKYTGNPSVKPTARKPDTNPEGPLCRGCDAAIATRSCLTHNIPICNICVLRHKAVGCTIIELTLVRNGTPVKVVDYGQ